MYVHYLGWIFLLSALPSLSKKQKNSHGSHTEIMGATGHCLYHRLWPSGAGSNLWRAFMGSWVMPPLTGSIKIERGGEKNITINHGCGGCDCGSGSNSDSNSDGDGRGDGGSEALKITTTTAETAVAAAPE